jgi:hypothetical protein
MKMFVAFTALALAASPAFAQSGAATGSATAPAAQNDQSGGNASATQNANGERLICRRVEAGGAVGRMESRRVCLTAAQWRASQHNQ